MQPTMSGLEHAMVLVILGLAAVVLLLAAVFLAVSLAKAIQAQAPTPEPARRPDPAAAQPEPAAPEPVVVPKAKEDLDRRDEVPEELLPVIIAAAATAVGRPVRVKDVILVGAEKPNVWGTQGRIVIQRSHDTGSQSW